MFGHEGRGILEGRKPRMRTEETPDAKDRIRQLGEELERTRPDVLVAIGPLSNLGALARDGFPLPPLAIMGGKFSDVILEGMIPAIPEWNWFCDPQAVQEVISQDAKVLPRIVPAEVTFRTALPPTDVARLATGDALAQQLSTLCNEWLSFLRQRSGGREPRVALHDPLTAATLMEDELCPFADQRIRVDDGAASHREAGPPNICAATDVDNDALCLHLMEIWMGTHPGA
jgi:inosine-uridine nucleoside N-ribohydrolase